MKVVFIFSFTCDFKLVLPNTVCSQWYRQPSLELTNNLMLLTFFENEESVLTILNIEVMRLPEHLICPQYTHTHTCMHTHTCTHTPQRTNQISQPSFLIHGCTLLSSVVHSGVVTITIPFRPGKPGIPFCPGGPLSPFSPGGPGGPLKKINDNY